ncbi:MAG: tetrahydromethanopterin S-methyltransferase subunit H [Candidatus Brockarchaeota archaeon]|nr:tetrahydromethanopterin S-methyltransferase subunit H [Candidatus Brockarchaeota archaeon]
MWSFGKEQKIFTIGDVKVGGLPGKQATVLIGSIFYSKHHVLVDEAKGEFEKDKAQELLKVQEEFSDKTGNPHMVDVVGSTPEALSRFVDFVAAETDAPILFDGVSADVRIKGLDYLIQSGIRNPIVYNSILPEFKKEELDKIKEAGVKSAVILSYNLREFTSAGRLKAVKNLLPIAQSAGIENILVDTCVIDVLTLGPACRAIYGVKDELGLPAGCGAHNAIGTWRGLKTKMGKQATHPSMASACAMAIASGANFILYGPIDTASYIFPAVAMVDAAYAQLLREQGSRAEPGHPIYKIA